MEPEVRRALASTFLARLASSAALRIVYPFLPAIARGLCVTPAELAFEVALRNLGSLTAPLAAAAAERRGRRTIMLLGATAVTGGCLLTAISDRFAIAAIGILLVGFARPVFDVATQAWFADRVPYAQRGRVFGIGELNWSLSLLVVPLGGYLILAAGWRAAFILVAIICGGGIFAVSRSIAPDHPGAYAGQKLHLDSPLLRVLATVVLLNLAAEIIFVAYGQWLERSFGLSVAGIGTFTIVILVSEFVGAGLVALISDSFGLKKMWMLSLAASAGAYLALSLVGSSLIAALGVVSIWIATYEMSFVASVPFISEMSRARERVLSLVLVSVGLGRAIGASIAQLAFSWGGIGFSGVLAALCVLLGLAVVAGVPEHVKARLGSSPDPNQRLP
jgi:predicted MFS family arabinose efflux permease